MQSLLRAVQRTAVQAFPVFINPKRKLLFFGFWRVSTAQGHSSFRSSGYFFSPVEEWNLLKCQALPLRPPSRAADTYGPRGRLLCDIACSTCAPLGFSYLGACVHRCPHKPPQNFSARTSGSKVVESKGSSTFASSKFPEMPHFGFASTRTPSIQVSLAGR